MLVGAVDMRMETNILTVYLFCFHCLGSPVEHELVWQPGHDCRVRREDHSSTEGADK